VETEINITFQGGTGGNGCISFRREKYVPKGGPDGGDGGFGGSVILKGTTAEYDLRKIKGRNIIKAARGEEGKSRKKTGKAGENNIINVPLGTRVSDTVTGKIIGEIMEEGEQLLVAQGGVYGKGNTRFSTSRNKIPLLAETGGPGEEKKVVMELFPLVDICVMGDLSGYAKSIFESITNINRGQQNEEVNIAPHSPFQVREVELNWTKYQIGLISFSNNNVDQLQESLNLIKRAKVIILVLELDEVDINIENIAQFLASNTIYTRSPEITFIKEELDLLGKEYIEQKQSEYVGLIQYEKESENIIRHIKEKAINILNKEFLYKKQLEQNNVIHATEEKNITKVEKNSEGYVVFNSRAERLVVLPDQRSFAARIQLRKELNTMGVIDALEKAGVKQGDNVKIGKKEFIWE
tara:strand:- start:1555 stop:2784 length:1230 start_codon:yes stop_codon:yes gene_type:complete